MRKKAKKTRRGTAPKTGTLGSLEASFFEFGVDATRAQVTDILEVAQAYVVMRGNDGQPSLRTPSLRIDVGEGIEYSSFNPLGWEWPYSLLRVRFEPRSGRENYLHHPGEEILIPIQGNIMYKFFWSGGGSKPQRLRLSEPLPLGKAIRINPQIPHHTWAVGGQPAEAWMVFRDLSETVGAISIESAKRMAHPAVQKERATRHRVITEKLLEKPGHYVLLAWGLSEHFRVRRERTHRTVAEVARACGIDPSHLSRIETGETNVSLETISRLARFLRLNLHELLEKALSEAAYYSLIGTLQKEAGVFQPVLCDDWPAHHLHISTCHFPVGQEVNQNSPNDHGIGTWIIESGRVSVTITQPDSSHNEVLSSGSVVHFQQGTPIYFRALEDSSVIKICYSRTCPTTVNISL